MLTIAEPRPTYEVRPAKLCWICEQPITEATPAKRGAHLACRERRETLLPSRTAGERLGLTPAQFLRLAKKLGVQPEGWYQNPHYRSGPDCPLWPPEVVEKLAGSAEVQSLLDRSQKIKEGRERKAAERLARLQAQYPDRKAVVETFEPNLDGEPGIDPGEQYSGWRDALGPAAEAMFNLNRYAKWERCSAAHREEIYTLKNEFVRLLYDLGLAVEARLHKVRQEGLECWGCDGMGCEKCGGSGWYRPRGHLRYIAFRFKIGEKLYSWHQPQHLVNWKVEFTPNVDQQTWQPEGEKPVNLPARQFADAKALIRFVLEQAKKRP